MFRFKGRDLPAHYAELLQGASDEDTAILVYEGWLLSAGVVAIKKTTNVETKRTIWRYRCINAVSTEDVKEVLSAYLEVAYKLHHIKFFQSKDEQKMSTEDVMYFHVSCLIGDNHPDESRTT